MRLEQFENLVRERRFGQHKTGQGSGRTLKALRFYLVNKNTVREACRKAGGLSDAALYNALKELGQLPRQRQKVKREHCPQCGQPLPNNKRAQSAIPTIGS